VFAFASSTIVVMNVPRQRASLYGRLSKAQKKNNVSRDSVLAKCRRKAGELDVEVVAEHFDNGVSGAALERKAFKAWLDDAMSGRVDVLIAPHVDRITRDGMDQGTTVLRVVRGQSLGGEFGHHRPVRLVTVEDGIDSEVSDFLNRFEQAITAARVELDRITQRNARTRADLISQGRWTGGPVPYGCQVVANEDGHPQLAPHEPEAELVRKVAQSIVEGESLRSQTRWLNSEGHRPRRAQTWYDSTLRQVLTTEATATHILSPSLRRALLDRIGGTRARPAARVRKGGRPVRWMLSGWGLCGSCGGKLTTTSKIYVCASGSHGGKCPKAVRIDAAQVDDHLTKVYLARYGASPHSDLVTVVEDNGLDDALRARDAAEAEYMSSRTPAALAAYAAAQDAVEQAEAAPVRRHDTMRVYDHTVAEEWSRRDPGGRATMLSWSLQGPPVILPASSQGGTPGIDTSRIKFEWAGSDEFG
jgi:site-specific DNA recombinase